MHTLAASRAQAWRLGQERYNWESERGQLPETVKHHWEMFWTTRPNRATPTTKARRDARVLIVSPYSPPSQLAGVHRARHLTKHLPSYGWTPIVLCVDEAYHEQRLDPELSRLVPASLDHQSPGAAYHVARRVGLGDIALRAWLPLRRQLLRLLASRPIDVVLITSAPYYPLLLASTIRRRFGTPVVIDLQDPWVSRWGAAQRP